MYGENNDRSSFEYHYSYQPNYSEPIPTLEPVQPKQPRRGRWRKLSEYLLIRFIAGL